MNKVNWRIVLICVWLLVFIQSPILWSISTILLLITGIAQKLWNSPWGVPQEPPINENHMFNSFWNSSGDELSDIDEIPSADDAFSNSENQEQENNQTQILDEDSDIPSPF